MRATKENTAALIVSAVEGSTLIDALLLMEDEGFRSEMDRLIAANTALPDCVRALTAWANDNF